MSARESMCRHENQCVYLASAEHSSQLHFSQLGFKFWLRVLLSDEDNLRPNLNSSLRFLKRRRPRDHRWSVRLVASVNRSRKSAINQQMAGRQPRVSSAAAKKASRVGSERRAERQPGGEQSCSLEASLSWIREASRAAAGYRVGLEPRSSRAATDMRAERDVFVKQAKQLLPKILDFRILSVNGPSYSLLSLKFKIMIKLNIIIDL